MLAANLKSEILENKKIKKRTEKKGATPKKKEIQGLSPKDPPSKEEKKFAPKKHLNESTQACTKI